MSITEISVKRPAALMMAVILVVGLGVIGYTYLGADLVPSTETPIISILTTYPGAGVDGIEKDIIKPIEDEVSAVSGLETIRSSAAAGYGYSILQFSMSTNMNTAYMDVQQALGDISKKLPKDASKPVLQKFNKNAEPILMLSVSGTTPYEEIYAQADKVKKRLEKLDGVANVTLEGAQKKELIVNIDKLKLDYYGVSVTSVINRLQAENVNMPAGEIKQENKSQSLKLMGEFQDISEIKDLPVPLTAGGSVRLADIAGVELKYPDSEKLLRLNDQPSIGIFVQKQSDANIVETTDRVKKELENVQKSIPTGVNLSIASDQSVFINTTLQGIKINLLEGIITTALVMLLFLRRWRPSLIVLVSIPTSLIATFFMMYVSGFSLNLISLLGLSVCIGILVDDSIVVLENIQRHMRQGKDPIRAAIDGRKEIAMAAVAITLCDVVVFGPVAFMSDMIGKFFREFGLTVVFATLFSLVVSFTITPMLASRLLKNEAAEEADRSALHAGMRKRSRGITFPFEKILNLYKGFLVWTLDHRWKIVVVVLIGFVTSGLLIPLKFISTEFLPGTDQGKLTIDIRLSPDSRLEQTDSKVREVEKFLKSIPEVKEYFSTVGINDDKSSARILVNLTGKNSRKRSQKKLAEDVRQWGKTLSGVRVSVTESSLVGTTSIDGDKPVILNITGDRLDVLKQFSKDVEKLVREVPGTTDVESSVSTGKSEMNVKVDRLASAQFGVSAADIAGVLRTAVSGTAAGVYRKNGDEFDIMVKFDQGQIKTAQDVGTIKIPNSAGQQVELSQVAVVSITDNPVVLKRMDRQSLVKVDANIEGRTLGSINSDIQEKLKTLKIPNGCQIKFGGDQENMANSFSSMIKAIIASIVLVYMILVVLYESFLTPFIRMLSLPCGIIGAFFALALTGKSLNLVTLIGLVMLDGLASKNGTLLIDYTNTLMKRGMSLREALIEAGTTRLRPIMMTSVTMIVGMLPTALALGEGSEIKSGMAIALIGGMVTSTLLSPVLLPAVYTIIDDFRNKTLPARREYNIG